MNKYFRTIGLTGLISSLLLVGCGPTAPAAKTPGGELLQGDKKISGKVTGAKVTDKTMVAVFGAFNNVSCNKIDAQNQTIDKDMVLAVAPVSTNLYSFALPKGPQKAQGAVFSIFAFDDTNNNKTYDDGEPKSKEAKVVWSIVGGYTAAEDAEGNKIADLSPLSEFKDFNFKLD